LSPHVAHFVRFATRRCVASDLALPSLLVLALASGCGEDFDPASEVSGLRVLAVKKSSPYVRPGDRVDFDLLWHDSEVGRPPPQIAWLAFCENPPGDLFEACFGQLPALTPEQLASRISLPEAGATAPNDSFSFVTSADLISSRPPPPEGSAIPYGLNYVFFAVCAGELAMDMGSQIPFVCYEELDGVAGFSAGDNRRDSRDFVIGYSAVFAYDELQNDNPRFTALEFGGVSLWPNSPAELGAAAPAGAVLADPRDVCVGESCNSAPPPADAQPCLDELTVDACLDDDCPETNVRAYVDPASAEVDGAASGSSSTPLGEQMWLNYYSTLGELAEGVRLVNDATAGFSADASTDYRAPDTSGAAYLWAVVHDNRGGTEWARLRVCVR
jgi:hypothetical protein